MEEIVALCKRRGFIFPSSEIYGGLGSTYDYGHYGVLLKNNVKAEWWRAMLQDRDDIVALDSAILQHPRVWEASGHLAGFTDPLVDCRTCKLRFRADKLEDAQCGQKPSKRPGEGPDCDLTEPRQFNLMFETHVGPVAGRARRSPTCARRLRRASSSTSRTSSSSRARSRRSGSPRSASRSATRSPPATSSSAPASSSRWRWSTSSRPTRPSAGTSTGSSARRWYTELGIRPDHLRLRAHDADELSHYSGATTDIEYLFPIGWSELEGIANRGDFDLTQHAKFSGEKLEYFDQETEGALRAARDRAGGRRRPRDARVPRRRLRHRGGRGPAADRAAPAPAAGAGQGRGAPAGLQGGHAREGARDLRDAARPRSRPSSTRAARSASATAARTRSAPPGASPSTARRWRTTPSPSATATRSSRPACRSRGSPTSWRAARRALGSPKLAAAA